MNKPYKIVEFNDNDTTLEVKIDSSDDTVWLIIEQMAQLFEVDRTGISRHIKTIYRIGELDENSTCQNLHIWGTLVSKNMKLKNIIWT